MKLLLFVMSLFTLTISSCEKEAKKCDGKCDPNMMCTMDFRMIGVTIKNASGKPVTLDNYKVTRIEGSKVMPPMESFWQEPGVYTLITDSEKDETDKCGKEFVLTGNLGDVEVVNEKYIIGHDCCHILLIKGKKEITIK